MGLKGGFSFPKIIWKTYGPSITKNSREYVTPHPECIIFTFPFVFWSWDPTPAAVEGALLETRVVGGLRIFGAPTIAGFRAALAVACFGTTTTTEAVF